LVLVWVGKNIIRLGGFYSAGFLAMCVTAHTMHVVMVLLAGGPPLIVQVTKLGDFPLVQALVKYGSAMTGMILMVWKSVSDYLFL
jgi:hypothetical protein